MNFCLPIPRKKTAYLPKAIFLLLLLIFCVTINAAAQSIVLRGTVVDEKGSPVEGASVSVVGTYKGTSSDARGQFRLANIPMYAKISFSAVGYAAVNRVLAPKDSGVINIVLKGSGRAELSVVTVGAYGLKTSARTSGTSRSLISEGRPVSAASALAGKVSGLVVSSESASSYTSVTKSMKAYDSIDDEAFSPERSKDKSAGYTALSRPGKSRMLTAGEVSDFKKWKMWEDYNAADFKAYSKRWDLFATDRYCVQLQNNESKAVIGQKIFLIDVNKGDTLWTAVSDNTGKAELWYGFTKKEKQRDLMIVIDKEKKQFPAVAFSQGVNRITLNKSCTASNKAEIAFLVDATGSMQDEINYLKEELDDVITKVAAKDSALELHTGAVFYRDRSDAYVTKIQPLTKGISNTLSFIKQQDAEGGGDYPEALDEGLNAAVNSLHWSADARTKIIFLLMDAPPHEDAKNKMAALIISAAVKGIRIVPVACSGTDKATEFIMRSIALATNGTYLLLTDDSGIGGSHIKPTTDEIKVELLNDLLQRIIEQMCWVNTCEHTTPGIIPIAPFTNTVKVKIFPNPTNGPVTIETTKKLKEIFITDFTGKILMHSLLTGKENYHFDLSAFPSAAYLIKYITEENTAGTEKIILMK